MSGERTLTGSYRTFRKSKWRRVGNYDEFFFSLGNLLNTCEQQLNSTPSDRSEFLFRRLDEYERTLSTLISRFCETYGHELSQQTCLADLTLILRRTSFLRSHFERHCFLLEDGFNKRTTMGRCNSATASNIAWSVRISLEWCCRDSWRFRQDINNIATKAWHRSQSTTNFLSSVETSRFYSMLKLEDFLSHKAKITIEIAWHF